MRAMIHIKSIGVGLAFVLGLVCIAALLSALVLSIASRLHQHETYYIALHFRYFWVPCILTFVAGFIWAYRHFSR